MKKVETIERALKHYEEIGGYDGSVNPCFLDGYKESIKNNKELLNLHVLYSDPEDIILEMRIQKQKYFTISANEYAMSFIVAFVEAGAEFAGTTTAEVNGKTVPAIKMRVKEEE